MTFLSRRTGRYWLLAATATMFAGGVLGMACSGDNKPGDGGPDATNNDGGGPDAKGDGGPGNDTGTDATPVTCEAGISGACDIIAQNCGAAKDCVVVQADGGLMTECVPNTTGTIKEGYACTQTGSNNPCVAGLECIDGRCAKHCCQGDDTACGTSHPENYTGRCNLSVSVDDSGVPAYFACAYSPSCQPFGIQPCATGQECIIQDQNGTSKCSTFSSADAGEGVTCQYANDCNKDGLGCFGAPDGGFTCQWTCYVPPGPYDAGITSQGAGMGGCPTNESCTQINWGGQLPSWLGLCK
jgi:hypothetical protein